METRWFIISEKVELKDFYWDDDRGLFVRERDQCAFYSKEAAEMEMRLVPPHFRPFIVEDFLPPAEPDQDF